MPLPRTLLALLLATLPLPAVAAELPSAGGQGRHHRRCRYAAADRDLQGPAPAPRTGVRRNAHRGHRVSNTAGVHMAGTDQLDIVFKGKGGHGSAPELAIDPVVMAAQAILSYQTIISRNVDPQSAAVLTVGAVQAGRDNNVIPSTATLLLNLRWLQKPVREQMLTRIDAVNRGVAIAAGMGPDAMPTRIMKGTAPPLVNDATLVDAVNPSLTALLGAGKVIGNFPTVMGSEDFQVAFEPIGTPYVFLLIGVAPVDRFAAA